MEIPASWGLASYLVTSLVLAVPLAYLILRWRLPFGTVTGYATSLALLAVTLADFHGLYAVAATALAGLGVDAFLLAARRRGVAARTQAVVSAALLPALAWSGQPPGRARAERRKPWVWTTRVVAGELPRKIVGVTDARVELTSGAVTVTGERPIDEAAVAAAVDDAVWRQAHRAGKRRAGIAAPGLITPMAADAGRPHRVRGLAMS